MFTSFRTAVSVLGNYSHDNASYDHLDQRVSRFKQYIDLKMENKWILEKDYNKYSALLSKGEGLVDKPSKLEFFKSIAPAMDNFYLFDGPSMVMINTSAVDWGPMNKDIYNSMQFHLPDEYQLYVYASGSAGVVTLSPVGKKSGLEGAVFYGVQGAYPSINVNFYFMSIYPPRTVGGMIYDFNYKGIGLDYLSSSPKVKKLLNIVGLDYLIYHRYYLDTLISPDKNLETLKSQGFSFFNLPDSFTFAPRFGILLEMFALQNPQSYGKAYVAKWVRFIDPKENHLNASYFDLPRHWPRSEKLLKNFQENIAKIPGETWRAVLIESTDPVETENKPMTFDAENTVEVKKIIGSKAVFDVDCQEDSCWFVYNTAALEGWKAYSGSERGRIQPISAIPIIEEG